MKGEPEPPLCKGRWVSEANPEGLLRHSDVGEKATTPQSPSVTAPLTQGSHGVTASRPLHRGAKGLRRCDAFLF